MTAPQLRMILVTVFACAAIVVACARRSTRVDTVPSRALGESTAPAPANPSAPAPDAAGVHELSSGPITGSTAGVPAQPAQPGQPSGGDTTSGVNGPVAANPMTAPDLAPLAADGGVTRAPADGGVRAPSDGGVAPADARPGTIDAGRPGGDAGVPRADAGIAPTTDGGSPTRP